MALITVKGRKPKVSTSDGHGMNTAGKRSPKLFGSLKSETGNFMHENEFNRRVETLLHVELKRCGFDVLKVAPTDDDTALAVRSSRSNSWGADFHLDIHANAFDGDWDKDGEGVETLYYNEAKSKACASVLQAHIAKGTGLKNRGIKDGSWVHMLSATKATANLVELGFMDDKDEIKLLLSESYRQKCAVLLAQGICEIFGMKYVPASKTTAPPKTTTPAKKTTTKPSEVKKGNMKTTSIVDYLKSIGQPSLFSDRKKLAEKYGIKNYAGTVAQNQALLKALRK